MMNALPSLVSLRIYQPNLFLMRGGFADASIVSSTLSAPLFNYHKISIRIEKSPVILFIRNYRVLTS